MRRTAEMSDSPSLTFDVGADPGRTWHLVVFVNNDKVHEQMIAGGAPTPGHLQDRHWEHVHLDLDCL